MGWEILIAHPHMEGNGTIGTKGVPCLLVFPLSYGVGHPQAERKSRSVDSLTMYGNV